MAVKDIVISDDGTLMTSISRATHHYAWRDARGWWVSYLPKERPVSEQVAIAALVFAKQAQQQVKGRGVSDRVFEAVKNSACQRLGARDDKIMEWITA